MKDSIQDKIASLTNGTRELTKMQRETINRCIRQLDLIDCASDNTRFAELRERYQSRKRMLLDELSHGDCDNLTLAQFSYDRRQLAETTKLRKKLGIDLPVENLDIN